MAVYGKFACLPNFPYCVTHIVRSCTDSCSARTVSQNLTRFSIASLIYKALMETAKIAIHGWNNETTALYCETPRWIISPI